MLHMNGTNASTTFTDSSLSPHTMTAHGNAQLSTTTPKFGSACGLFDGSGTDYVDTPDSADWDVVGSNADNWTIDFWYKPAASIVGVQQHFIGQNVNGSNFWSFQQGSTGMLGFSVFSSGSQIINCQSAATGISDTSYHHIALCKVADKYGIYLDGIQIQYTQDSDTATFGAVLTIGRRGDDGAGPINGRIDELRIQQSNYFNASPNGGLSDTISVPAAEYDTSIVSASMSPRTNYWGDI